MKFLSRLLSLTALVSSLALAAEAPRTNERLEELIRTYISIQGPLGKLKARDGVNPESIGAFDLEFTFDELKSFSDYVKKLNSSDQLLVEGEMLRQARLSMERAEKKHTDAKNNDTLTLATMCILEATLASPAVNIVFGSGRLLLISFTKGSFKEAWATPRSRYFSILVGATALALAAYLIMETIELVPTPQTLDAKAYRDAFEKFMIERETEYADKAEMAGVVVPPRR